MKRNRILIILILIFIIIVASIAIFEMNNTSSVLLGENNLGKVSVEGPYGNPNSDNKIALIVGVHPLEFKSHNALLKYVRNYSDSLNNSYYIYIVNVTKDSEDFDKSRLNGQKLAREYVVTDIINKNYTFSVDFHGHRGVYTEKNFIIAPLNDKKSAKLGKKVINNISGMKILNFVPAEDGHPSSPDYVSIPILKNGTLSIIYETYINESENVTNRFMSEFVLNLDNNIV